MSNQRTVLVESISYLGTDGKDHVAHKGDKITVAAAGVDIFDFFHNDTPEYRIAEEEKRQAANERAAKDKASAAAEAKKA
jgi:hypothetical protein